MTKCSDFDIIINIPMYKKKEIQRGYNQSALIACEAARLLEKPYYKDILEKTIDTSPQSELNRAKRLNNIRNAFTIANTEKIINKKILIIDDIITTGATVDECSKVLKKAGAKEVIVSVIATGKYI
jgi:ComF family protein